MKQGGGETGRTKSCALGAPFGLLPVFPPPCESSSAHVHTANVALAKAPLTLYYEIPS